MLSVVTLKRRLLFYFPITVVLSRRQSPRPLNSQNGSYFWSLIGTSADPSPSGKDRTLIRMTARLLDLAHPLQWAKTPWESHQGSRQPTSASLPTPGPVPVSSRSERGREPVEVAQNHPYPGIAGSGRIFFSHPYTRLILFNPRVHRRFQSFKLASLTYRTSSHSFFYYCHSLHSLSV